MSNDIAILDALRAEKKQLKARVNELNSRVRGRSEELQALRRRAAELPELVAHLEALEEKKASIKAQLVQLHKERDKLLAEVKKNEPAVKAMAELRSALRADHTDPKAAMPALRQIKQAVTS